MSDAKIEILQNEKTFRTEVYVNRKFLYDTKNSIAEEKNNIRLLLWSLDEDNPENKPTVQ